DRLGFAAPSVGFLHRFFEESLPYLLLRNNSNGSSPPGQNALKRLEAQYPNAIMVHTPVHASWLNQIEIYFSIIQRKLLTPNDFESLVAVEDRLKRFAQLHNAHPKPFNWQFDR